MRWKRHRQALTIRRTVAIGVTTDKARSLRRICGAFNYKSEEAMMASALSNKERSLMDAYWRAANYLSVGQIYFYDNPLLKSPSQRIISSRGSWATGERPLA